MITISNEIKDLYKAYNREIKCYGDLYFKERRMSNNLLNPDTFVSKNNLEYTGVEHNYTTGNHQQFFKTTDEEATEIGYKLYNNNTLVSEGDSLSLNSNEIRFNITNNNANKIMIYFNTTSDTYVIYNIPNSIGATDNFTLGLKISNVKNGPGFNDNIERLGFYHIFIAKNHNILEYEPYNTKIMGLIYKQTTNSYEAEHLTFSQENNTEILSFDLNLKTDVYYTSMPYNTLKIEVNNEEGYFTDYANNSITSKLNSDCCIKLYLQIFDGENLQEFKLITMNFDNISYSDYTKATLEFKSCLSYTSNLKLQDKFLEFTNENYNVVITRDYLRSYLDDNYNIKMTYPQDAVSSDNWVNSKLFSVQDMILNAGTCFTTELAVDQSIYLKRAVLTTNNSNDEIALRNFDVVPQEYITKEYELDKPIMKRENSYDRLKYTYEYATWNNNNYEQTSETYKKTITGILSSTQENILLIDNDYKICDFTTSDITASQGISISIPETQFNPRMFVLTINGNIDSEYTITIEKANIYKKKNRDIRQIDIGNKSETTKTLEIKENSPVYNDYYQVILYENKILSNVEVKLMALPYLELGDTIAVEIDDAYLTMTISEINLMFGDGLTQTIKGYRLGWLYPSETLYPREDLYPNTPDINKIN